MKTASFIRHLDALSGDARLYLLSSPIVFGESYDWVIVSATNAFTAPETYIFPATSEGEILSWNELPGSYRGSLDHTQALRNAGYLVLGH